MLNNNASRLFVVTCRLPLRIEAGTEKIHVYSRRGGVIAGIGAFAERMKERSAGVREMYWAGSPGCSTGTWSRVLPGMHIFPYGLCPVFLPTNELEAEGSNLIVHEDRSRVTQEFAHTLGRYIRPNDTIWIPDFRLLSLGARIRKHMPETNIGVFVAVPFPTYEEMWKVPREQQEELLCGMLGADLISFQTEESRENFLKCVQLLLGIDNDEKVLRHTDRLITTAVIPAADDMDGTGEWLDSGLALLRDAKTRQLDFQVRFFDMQSKNELLDKYRSAQKRLFLLDYDGTLTPFFNMPSLARPDNLLLDILDSIAKNPRNSVYIVSGRDSQTLDSWLGHLPVNIIAEHGARIRQHGDTWKEKARSVVQWREAVAQVMQRYQESCLHSFIEQKDYSMVWHYRNSPPEEARNVKLSLYAELCRLAERYGLQVMIGNKIIEVRNEGTDKGTAIRGILSEEERDFILAIGDDRTDEDMFRMLTEVSNACTIKVGAEASFARFNMHTPQMVISLLGNMVHLERQALK